MRLADAGPRQPMTVMRVLGDSDIARRLLELGLTVGTRVQITGHAPLGGAVRVSFGGHQVAMRVDEANLVEVTSAA